MSSVKVAVTAWIAVMDTLHVAVPVHAPVHALNVEPDVAAADNVTLVPELNDAEQVAPHEIPAGALVTVPKPVPALVTFNANVIDWVATDKAGKAD